MPQIATQSRIQRHALDLNRAGWLNELCTCGSWQLLEFQTKGVINRHNNILPPFFYCHRLFFWLPLNIHLI
jgi:hypothetical protein